MARILVVDDSPISREFVVALLGYAGHELHEAGDGRRALALAREVGPALVISDILMPSMDGVELARELRADPGLSRVPVIFYTATYRVTEARTLAAQSGVSAVLAKPCEPQALLDAVHEQLGIAAQVVAHEHIATLTGHNRRPAVDRVLSSCAEEISGLQMQLRGEIETEEAPATRVDRLEHLSTRLDESLNRSQALSLRLATLAELGSDLATYKNPAGMLEMFCHAARDVMNARVAAVCTLDEHGSILDYSAWGMTAAQVREVRDNLVATAGVFGDVMRMDLSQRRRGLSGRHSTVGLPGCHPPVDNLLAVPVKSATRTHGWFYAADRLAEGEFSDEDAQLAEALAAQLAPEYENLLLFDEIKRHAGLLEVQSEERRQALEALGESNARFRQLAESVQEVFFLSDASMSEVLYVSPAYTDIWGRSCESLYSDPLSWLDAVRADDYRAVLKGLARARRSGTLTLKFRIQRSDGTGWVKVRSFPVRDASGELSRIAATAEDITETALQERKIARLSRIHAVLSGINSAIVRIRNRNDLLDEICRVTVVHGGFALAWVGLARPGAEHLEFTTYAGKDSGTAEELAHAFAAEGALSSGLLGQALRSETHVVHEAPGADRGPDVLRLARAKDYRSAIALRLTPDNEPAGAIVLLAEETGVFDEEEIRLLDELSGDVSFALEYLSREERLHYLAYYDALTGLPNTALFHDHLAQSIEQDPDARIALFLIDLDNFTHLNDTLGRHVGDQLLIECGKRLQSIPGTHGDVARIGSDTFAVAVSSLRDDMDAGGILQERITAALSRPFHIEGNELRVSARVGIAVRPTDGSKAERLFKSADAALKEAKTSGTRHRFYSSRLNERISEDIALEQQLISAVEKQEFELHYQPKIDAKSGGIIGLEALLRWNSPEHGLVPPGRFIGALETSELILDVGQWVLEQTLLDHEAWRRKRLTPPPMAVNVSPLQLRYSDFADMVFATIEQHGCAPETLELEITESVIMADIESSIERLRAISSNGVTVAIDDFGTGYSSLRYLAKLPLQALKIDRSFIASMTAEADSLTLVSTIIGLAHSFGLLVVAEGVETEEQAKLLRLMKCDQMQGFLFGRPQPAAEIDRLLPRATPD